MGKFGARVKIVIVKIVMCYVLRYGLAFSILPTRLWVLHYFLSSSRA